MDAKEKQDYDDAMKSWQEEEQEQHRKDTLIIRSVKKSIPKKLFKLLNSEIYESESYSNFRIISKPIGEFQGPEKNIWVDQYDGYFRDDFHGTICFKLPDNIFLAWDYSM